MPRVSAETQRRLKGQREGRAGLFPLAVNLAALLQDEQTALALSPSQCLTLPLWDTVHSQNSSVAGPTLTDRNCP